VGRLLVGDKTVEAEGVVFDKDGTLVDFTFAWLKISEMRMKLMVNSLGIAPQVAQAVQKGCGVDPGEGKIDPRGPLVMASVQDEILIASGILYQNGYPWDEARRLAEEAFVKAEQAYTLKEVTRPVPYLQACLAGLREGGFRLAIVTLDEGRRTQRVLDLLKIRDFFDYVVTLQDVSQSKPHPEAIWVISEYLRIPRNKLVMVGDAVTDMRMGRKAGMAMTVGILNGITPPRILEGWADVVIDSLAEIKII